MNITIKRFIELTIRTFDGYWDGLTKEEAHAIQQEDKQETFCHVQPLEDAKGSTTGYRLWAIQDWLSHYEKQKADKAAAKIRVAEHDKRERNLRAVAKALATQTGLDESYFYNSAVTLLKKDPRSVELLGVTIEE